MNNKFRSEVSAGVHETASGMFELGLISAQRMREYDVACLRNPESVEPEQVKKLRTANDLTQADFADQLNVSPQLVSRWERGLSTPRGAALKLLLLVRDKGIDAIS